MLDKQEQHLKEIKSEFLELVDKKYRTGAKEHNSTLSEDYNASQLLDMAIEEATDQVVYLLTLKAKL